MLAAPIAGGLRPANILGAPPAILQRFRRGTIYRARRRSLARCGRSSGGFVGAQSAAGGCPAHMLGELSSLQQGCVAPAFRPAAFSSRPNRGCHVASTPNKPQSSRQIPRTTHSRTTREPARTQAPQTPQRTRPPAPESPSNSRPGKTHTPRRAGRGPQHSELSSAAQNNRRSKSRPPAREIRNSPRAIPKRNCHSSRAASTAASTRRSNMSASRQCGN
jgi:hypothetical protein